MSFKDTTWYCNYGDGSTTGYYAVAKWAATTTYTVGALIRQNAAPSVGNERVFVCYSSTGGTGQSGAAEPTWTVTRGAQNTDNTVKWQEITGCPPCNSDLTSGPNWAAVKNTVISLGQVIVSGDGTKVLLCTTAGTTGNGAEPTWAAWTNSGATTADNTATWTTIGNNGAQAFAAGAAPHNRLANVYAGTWAAAGNTCFVGDNHAETQATAITLTPPGGGGPLSQFFKTICHDHAGSYPPTSSNLKTTATVTVTAGGGNININPSSASFYWYGISFIMAATASFATINLVPINAFYYFDNCSFQQNSTSANSGMITLNTTSSGSMVWNNCTVKFGATAQTIDPGTVQFIWRNTGQVLVSGSSIPTSFIGPSTNGRLFDVTLEGLDLSQLTGNIWAANATAGMGILRVIDCKLNASATEPTPLSYGSYIQHIRSDSGATAFKSTRTLFEGTESTETSITRVGGSVDPAGNAQSRKIVTTANVLWLRPFKAQPEAIWNTKTAANVTVSIYGTINSASLPNNDDIWVDLEYLGTASFPLGVFATSTKANVQATGVAVSSDGSTWNGGGSGAGWSPFVIQIQLDTTHNPQPQFQGYIMCKVRAAKASTTFYIDPQPVLS